MHAWSEVEHDIIYKNKFRLPENPTMNRMLDGINGLSITSEILLQELQRAFNNLRERDEVRFSTYESLCNWLFKNYNEGVEEKSRWD
jgi:ppGpp synthetase/RelA/SpoT-type nucleotidyltranferase